MRLDSVTRLLFTLLFMYCFTLGATWNGVLIPQVSLMTLGLLALLFGLWWVLRWRGGWAWHTTTLDPALLLWGAAFGLSLLANADSWRKIMMGLWYMGLYAGLWYALHDLISNGKLKRGVLVEAFLFGGLLNLLFGYLQLALSDIGANGLPRLVGLVGNPNAFGLFMVVLLLLILGQWFSIKHPVGRVVLGLYFLAGLPLLILSFSRGALIGMMAACLSFAFFMLQAERNAFNHWWKAKSRLVMMGMAVLAGLVGALVLLVGAVLVLQTLGDAGRDPVLRGRIYSDALTAFTEKPLTGHGLFTFGEALGRLQSQPPQQPHSHAHNAFLHISAELGIVGLAALLPSLGLIFMTLWRGWRGAAASEKPLLAALIALLIAYGVTHLFDMLVMMPLFAFIGLLILAMATTVTPPQPIQAQWRLVGHPIGMMLLWGGLLASGWWSSLIYADYSAILQASISEENYRAGADELQRVVDADPNMALYLQQQAYLYGVAAYEADDPQALSAGIRAYERYITLQPHDSISRVNLAALHWQAGHPTQAIAHMQQATESAPNAWQYLFILGNYAEAAGELPIAIGAYKRLTRNSYNLMYPEWEDTAFRREFAWGVKRRGLGALVLALDEGSIQTPGQAAFLWEQSQLEAEDSSRRYVLRLLLSLQAGAGLPDDAAGLLSRAEAASTGSAVDAAWLHVAYAAMRRAEGDAAGAAQEIALSQQRIAPAYTKEDYPNGTNIAHFQYLRYATPRQFLPQVYYPTVETLPLLRFLTEN